MTKFFQFILKKTMIAITVICMSGPVLCADSNITGTIGDYGSWATAENRDTVIKNMKNDLDNFGPTESQGAQYIPFEVRLGVAFMRGMSQIGNILDNSLGHFSIIFILVAFAFWVMMESYQMMTSDSNVKKLAENIVKKGLLIAGWIIVLHLGPAKVFMMIMGPVVSVGTYIANFILSSITSIVGVNLQSCDAIYPYIQQNLIDPNNPNAILISAESARDIMCLPTRITSFFATTIGMGWKWIGVGIGTSLFSVIIGGMLLYVSIRGIWKFTFVALGVVADLFLTVLMLPFTAIAETVAKTSYKGIIGDIFNTFLSIFKTEKLSEQINRFISAAIHFIALAVVIGVTVGLMSSVIEVNVSGIPNQTPNQSLIVLLVTYLAIHILDKSDELAKKWSGGINTEFGDKVKGNVTGLWKASVKQTKDWYKAIKETKK